MAVCDIDPMAAQRIRHGPGTRRRKGRIESKVLHCDTGPRELPCEPPVAARRQDYDAPSTSRLEIDRKIRDNLLGAARTVRLNQLSDAEHTLCNPTESAMSV